MLNSSIKDNDSKTNKKISNPPEKPLKLYLMLSRSK